MKISDSTSISMPMRNLLSILAAVAVGVWAYFGVIERLNNLETKAQLSEKDLQQVEQRLGADIDKNNEFRIKWPRGELGSPPADSEQFMLIEHIAMQVEKIQERMENMMNNGVNIKRLQEDVKLLREDVEKLKDSNREMKYTNGNSH
jgi:succinate dehydrogenase/fumarate reductase flavoprotein subunit